MAMQRDVAATLEGAGFETEFLYLSMNRWERWRLWPSALEVNGKRTYRFGYLPSIDFLNYLGPALGIRSLLDRYEIFDVVSGTSAAALPLVLAGRPFVSWIATTTRAELRSVRSGTEASRPSLSVRLNNALLPFNEALERTVLRRTPKLFALSKRTAEEFADQGVAGAEVLYPPIDLGAYDVPKAPAMFPTPYVFGAGRIDDPRKDFPFLIRAVEIARRQTPSLSLVLGGAVDPGSQVAAFGRARLGDAFVAAGNLQAADLARAYSGASAFALTSRQEGLGIVAAEAMASGIPTVQRRCGGADELVEESATGFLLGEEDLEGFAARLALLVSTPILARQMGAQARKRAGQLFSPTAFRRTLLEAHRQLFPASFAA
jgi:glycosyltransferase involved in cell wall biosynthesis